MNQHPAVVVDETKLAELVHEVADSCPGCSDHSCQHFLTDLWNHRLQLTFLAKVRKQKQNPSQPLLARIEQLINQVLFKSNIAGEQVGREDLRESWVGVQQPYNGPFADTLNGRVFIRRGRRHAQVLPGQTAFTEELISTKKRHDSFLPLFGNYG